MRSAPARTPLLICVLKLMNPMNSSDIHRMMRTRLLSALVAVVAVSIVAPAAGARDLSKTVVAVGDIACSPGSVVTATKCHQQGVGDLTRRLRPDQLWLAGDIQYSRGERENFDGAFHPAFGDLRGITRPVPGNHEYYTAGAAGYFGYFGRRAGDPRRGYYSFNIGSWHVVALNSNCGQVPCGYRSQQLRWLKRDLRANPNRCVAAIWHHPLYSSGSHGANHSVRPLWRALTGARAEFGVTGHDHHFEAFLPQDANGVVRPRTGLVEYVVGTGGKSLYPVSTPGANREALVQNSFGVLALELRPRGWSWRFVNEAGSTLAAGRRGCR